MAIKEGLQPVYVLLKTTQDMVQEGGDVAVTWGCDGATAAAAGNLDCNFTVKTVSVPAKMSLEQIKQTFKITQPSSNKQWNNKDKQVETAFVHSLHISSCSSSSGDQTRERKKGEREREITETVSAP